MEIDKTQQQSSEGLRKAKELSLQRAAPPTEVADHELQQFIGAGAYGEVWSGINLTTRRKVAVKFFLHHDAVDWSLLDRETEKMALLSSDRCVVQLLHVGWDSEPRYYVMEYVENGSLEDYLREHGALPVGEAVTIFREIVVGLTHAHAKGVLHCDLKPANILLDADHKPRLADFGQSRLASEQTPALGTLFYMAPEQADLNARPDVRWDVYALGALLYTMLVGQPPHRTEMAIGKIDTAASLAQRLACYRDLLARAPRPSKHRQVRGVDNALADIVDRCLAPAPRDRYATVREILGDIDVRNASRSRRPLMMLGVVGPIVLLLIMLLFGWRGYEKAVDAVAHSTDSVRRHAYESNTNATRYVAIALRAEIETIFRIAETEAETNELIGVVRPADAAALARNLSQDAVKHQENFADLLADYRQSEERQQLEAYLGNRLDVYLEQAQVDPHAPRLASMFAMNRAGVILAVAYADKSVRTSSVGKQYRYRSYFNGKQEDLDPHSDLSQVEPLSIPYFSAPFQSTSTKKWKVAVSVPFAAGILVVTVNLGEFTSLHAEAFRESSGRDSQLATIIYDRPGDRRGMILQHPHFAEVPKLERDYRVTADVLDVLERRLSSDDPRGASNPWDYRYFDPLANAVGGDAFEGPWIATVAAVAWADDSLRSSAGETDLLVMLQEREEAVIAPVKALTWDLVKEAGFAAIGFVLTVFVLWYFVWQVTREPRRKRRKRIESPMTSLHQRATEAMTDGQPPRTE